MIGSYLPPYTNGRPYNRQYLFNVSSDFEVLTVIKVVNSLKPDFFAKNIPDALKNKKNQILQKKNQLVEITEQMYSILTGSQNLATGKGFRS